MSDSQQGVDKRKPFRLGRLGTINQAIVATGKVLRAMACGDIDGQLGARLCNGLGVLRAMLETRRLDELADRMGELEELRMHGGQLPTRQQLKLGQYENHSRPN
jgi:hypothetical protein